MHRWGQSWPVWIRLAVATAIIVSAVALRLVLLPVSAGLAFVTIGPAVLLTYLLCGTLAGIFATLLGAASGSVIFRPPAWSWAPTWDGVVGVCFFIVSSLLVGQFVRHMRQRERALYRTLAIRQALYNSDILGLAIVRGCHYEWTNQGLERMLGCCRGELYGRAAGISYAEEAAYHATGRAAAQCFAEEKIFRGELQLIRRDGTPFWADVVGYKLSGRADESLWIVADVTARRGAEAALRRSEALLVRTNAVARVGGWELDVDSQTVTWTDETCRLHDQPPGYRPSLAEALEYYDSGARPIITQAVRDAVLHGTSWDIELPMISATGRRFWAQVAGEADYEGGRVIRLAGAFKDVTARRAMQADLTRSHAIHRATLQSMADAVITTNEAGTVTWMNLEAERLTGCASAQALGRPLPQVFAAADEDSAVPMENPVTACLAAQATLALPQHTVLTASDGTMCCVDGSAAPMVSESGQQFGAVLVFRDVTRQRQAARDIAYRASHDPLTGLANRAEFETRLGRLLTRMADLPGRHALLAIDLDQFKLVNDSCGHAAGDRLLGQVATLLRDSVRARDSVARLGGDEFGIILENCDPPQALRLAQKLCDQIDRMRFEHDGKRFRVGASIGLAAIDGHVSRVETLLSAADTACYAAKQAGRNRVHLWVENDSAIAARQGDMHWARRLQTAVDDNDFVLFGQRITPFDAPGASPHIEVLIRLRQPDGSLVSPGLFFPAAERFFMATLIDRWVVGQAFGLLAANPAASSELGALAINLSGQSIGDPSFREDVLMALDDFGAGASSFGYLKNLTVDFIKIDGQFVRDLLDDKLARVAVRCFVDAARTLDLVSIAECIETADVLAELRALGVDMAQGYLLHRPEPLAALLPACAGARVLEDAP